MNTWNKKFSYFINFFSLGGEFENLHLYTDEVVITAISTSAVNPREQSSFVRGILRYVDRATRYELYESRFRRVITNRAPPLSRYDYVIIDSQPFGQVSPGYGEDPPTTTGSTGLHRQQAHSALAHRQHERDSVVRKLCQPVWTKKNRSMKLCRRKSDRWICFVRLSTTKAVLALQMTRAIWNDALSKKTGACVRRVFGVLSRLEVRLG